MPAHTPNNPTKAPSVPTGPSASSKTSNSKVMSPMSKAGKTVPSGGKVRGATGVSPKAQSQTVNGGPKR
jgi:hypothetical protein